MNVRSRSTIALAVTGLILVGVGIGAGVGLAQSPSPSPSSSPDRTDKALRHDAFLDDVARRLGIQRSRLDNAIKAQALAEVNWAEVNGFITTARADALRERINAGTSKGLAGLKGRLGIGLDGIGHRGSFKRGFRGGPGSVAAAANFLGLSAGELKEALRSKTLAQVARDQGKSVDGLTAALRAAIKARLDEAVTNGRITQAQENALLSRFDSEIGSVINGVPPALTDLARRLDIDRSRVIAAIKNAAIAQVDSALAQGLITEQMAEAMRQRIRSSAAWPLGGKILRGIGGCGGGDRMGAPSDELGFRFYEPLMGEDALGI
ncbi:MAG: hypothetical protein ACRDHO_05625 [Actinomycetota bacterium]